MPNSNPEMQASPVGARPLDRRAWIRFGADLDAECHAKGAMKDAGWTAKVKDISKGGVGLLLRHRFKPGTQLMMELKSRDGTFCHRAAITAVRVIAFLSGNRPQWFMGCSFDTPLADEDLQRLL
jgi:PilZ domain